MIYDICFNLIFLSLLHWFQTLRKFYCLIFRPYKILLFNLGCNNWIISPRNHIFGRAIWNKLPECIFENFEISNFSKIARMIYLKNRPNQACDYWFITPKQQTLYIEINIFKQRAIINQQTGNYKITPLMVQCRLQSILWLYKTVPFSWHFLSQYPSSWEWQNYQRWPIIYKPISPKDNSRCPKDLFVPKIEWLSR